MSNLDQLFQQLSASTSSNNEEKNQFKTKLRANIVWLEPNSENEKGYVPITLPFGIALELSPEQRSKQGAKSLALMDGLAEMARQLPEGTSKELNPVIGGLTIQIRHSGEAKMADTTQLNSLFSGLANQFK